MNAEFDAAERLLNAILSKRGQAKSGRLLSKLVAWAQKQGYFASPPTLFQCDEWRRLGDHMWQLTIKDKDKPFKDLKETWQTVVNTLESMKAESRVAAAAVQALAPEKTETAREKNKTEQQKRSWFACPIVQSEGLLPMKGLTAKRCNTIAELLPPSPAPSAPPAPAPAPPAPNVAAPQGTPQNPPSQPGVPVPVPTPETTPLPPDQDERMEGDSANEEAAPFTSISLQQVTDNLRKVINKLDGQALRALEHLEQIAAGKEFAEKKQPASLNDIIMGKVASSSTMPVRKRWNSVIKETVIESN